MAPNLQQLAARLSPEQIVLVVDGTTPKGMIESAMLNHGASKLPKMTNVVRNATVETNQVFADLTAAAYETR
jgi:ribosomal protein L16/L10AE